MTDDDEDTNGNEDIVQQSYYCDNTESPWTEFSWDLSEDKGDIENNRNRCDSKSPE